jgi:twitching motility protein PilT
MQIIDFFHKALEQKASDLFCIAGLPLTYKVGNQQFREGERMMPDDTEAFINELYVLASNRPRTRLDETGEDDFSFSIPGMSRFRVNVYRQRDSLAAVIRIITFTLPKPEEIGIPSQVMDLASFTRGLVLVTGPAGSGKSTTQACMIDQINQTRSGHIITLEDPIEYLHRHSKSIVSQREVGVDTTGYIPALRAALRQAPDVILLGEMRDHETIQVAMTAAETGHLVISTLHTTGAANTVDRIIDAFPPNQQGQIRIQLSMTLRAVVSQQLVPGVDGSVLPAFEVMRVNTAISNLIREAKIQQIDAVIQSSAAEGMQTMDGTLLKLYHAGKITKETALHYGINREQLQKRLDRSL